MIDRDDLRSPLDAHDHRRILQSCGFEINGKRGPKLSEVLGPQELGEGETGNFSVDLPSSRVTVCRPLRLGFGPSGSFTRPASMESWT